MLLRKTTDSNHDDVEEVEVDNDDTMIMMYIRLDVVVDDDNNADG